MRAKTEQEIAARRAAFEQSTRELLRSRCDTDILPEEGKVGQSRLSHPFHGIGMGEKVHERFLEFML